MGVHKVIRANAIDAQTLLVYFDNQQVKKYNITALLKNTVFSALANPEFFKMVRVEQGGYAVYWNEEIDISEYELWSNGVFVAEESAPDASADIVKLQ